MSSIIAVSVSLIGLLAAVFTLVIFVELIVSFPAMLTSNSQVYVKQQRETYTLGSSHSHNMRRAVQHSYQLQVQQQQEDEDLERWYDDNTAAWVDEHMYPAEADAAAIAFGSSNNNNNNNNNRSSTGESRRSDGASVTTTAASLTTKQRRREMTVEPMTRGRTLRRVSRRHNARTSLRV